ncbi:DNA-primase RepB domain-containing protein, partial [Vibrio parahaemolyticus]|nr:DNA-primase RepB domain-containing protein [Vibrio parahaemolyticus]
VLVDDLSEFDLDDMKAEGREPALIVETSPKNYQAWVKVAQDAPAGHRGVIARKLAREYDADPASADSRHYGRLAGFTNRKDKHTTRTGYQPWVLLRESKGKTATAGPELMQQAGQVLDSIKRQQERTARLAEITAPRSVRRYRRSAVDDYRSEMAGLVKRFGDDLSKCDFIAAMKLASKGREPDEIGKAMAEASPAIMERKAGHEADYIKRTV